MATKDLDFGNVIKQVYDPPTESLKVLATITIGSISVDLDAATDSVRLGDGTVLSTFTTIGPKNALDVNIAAGNLAISIDQADDSIRLGDGTTLFTGTTVGPKTGLDVNLLNTSLSVVGPLTDAELRASAIAVSVSSIPLASGAATETKQDSQITILGSIDTKLTSPLAITAASLPLPSGAATATNQTTANASLASIDSKLTSPLAVTTDLEAFTGASPDNVQTVGSIDGTKTGTKYGFVNNLRQQILASQDRNADFTYADFGTKNQRVTRIDYTSATFPGFIIRRDFTYTLQGNQYRRDDEVWSVV